MTSTWSFGQVIVFTSLSHFVRGSAMLVLLDNSCFARLLGGSHARARLLFEGNFALHSGERFVRARSFRVARPVVRVDDEHGHQPFLVGSRALHVPATVRSSTREWACSSYDAQSRSRDLFSRSALLRNPCSLLRANTSLRTIRGLSGAHLRSSYGLSMTKTFWAPALLRTVVRLSLFCFLG